MELKIFMLIMGIVVMTAGLLSASRLMSVSLTLGQALIASVTMSMVGELFGSSRQASLVAIIASFLISIIPLKLLTKESMWGTIKLSIAGTLIGAALLLLLSKLFFPVSFPVTRM
jgi:hypothetical protein